MSCAMASHCRVRRGMNGDGFGFQQKRASARSLAWYKLVFVCHHANGAPISIAKMASAFFWVAPGKSDKQGRTCMSGEFSLSTQHPHSKKKKRTRPAAPSNFFFFLFLLSGKADRDHRHEGCVRARACIDMKPRTNDPTWMHGCKNRMDVSLQRLMDASREIDGWIEHVGWAATQLHTTLLCQNGHSFFF
ncbi:hypothetical protein BC940DRAFT_37029 [Gongronella butleri]|nr:hypothetical protein BC940DRAFT_37029 [Gongronella butleri]